MRLMFFGLLALLAALSGCVVAPAQPRLPAPQAVYGAEQELDLVPPVPTFESFADCEMAYGAGACGNGAQVYASANLAPPPYATSWYMPFAFGVMTGVLVNRHYAPPTRYVPHVHYRSYVSPVVVQKYRVITPNVIEVYRRAPPAIRHESAAHGPVRFAPHHGVITARPHSHGYQHAAPPPARMHRAPEWDARPGHGAPAATRVAPPPQRHSAPAGAALRQAAPQQPAPAPVQGKGQGRRECNPSLPKSAINCAG